eukprot:969900-Pelagomonas_calceolata.AAC.1
MAGVHCRSKVCIRKSNCVTKAFMNSGTSLTGMAALCIPAVLHNNVHRTPQCDEVLNSWRRLPNKPNHCSASGPVAPEPVIEAKVRLLLCHSRCAGLEGPKPSFGTIAGLGT